MGIATTEDIKAISRSYDKAQQHIDNLRWKARMLRLMGDGNTWRQRSDALVIRADWLDFVIGNTDVDPRGTIL